MSQYILSIYDFTNSLQIGFCALILISFFAKRSLPLTRKLIDVAQTIGLFFYFNQYYSQHSERCLKILQLANFSTIIPNYIALSLYGQVYTSGDNHTQKQFITILDQNPSSRFYINQKSASFLANIMQLIVFIFVSFLIYAGICGIQIILSVSRGDATISKQIKTYIYNFFFIVYYVTFQECSLYMALQFQQFSFSNLEYGIGGIIALVNISLFIFVVARIIQILNSVDDQFINRELYPFLYDFEDQAGDYLGAKEETKENNQNQNMQEDKIQIIEQKDQIMQVNIKENKEEQTEEKSNQLEEEDYSRIPVIEQFKKNPIKVIASNWIVLALFQKVINAFIIVFLDKSSPEIGLLVNNIIFIKLFFFMRPIKNRVILMFCLIMDIYLNIVLIFHNSDYLPLLLWPGILCLNVLMIGEDVLSQYFYKKAPQQKIIPSTNYHRDLQIITPNNPNELPNKLQYIPSNNDDTLKQSIYNNNQLIESTLVTQDNNNKPFNKNQEQVLEIQITDYQEEKQKEKKKQLQQQEQQLQQLQQDDILQKKDNKLTLNERIEQKKLLQQQQQLSVLNDDNNNNNQISLSKSPGRNSEVKQSYQQLNRTNTYEQKQLEELDSSIKNYNYLNKWASYQKPILPQIEENYNYNNNNQIQQFDDGYQYNAEQTQDNQQNIQQFDIANDQDINSVDIELNQRQLPKKKKKKKKKQQIPIKELDLSEIKQINRQNSEIWNQNIN